MKKKFFAIFFLVIFSLVGFFLINQSSKNLTPENIKQIKIAGQNIKAILALNEEKQTKGLSGKEKLENDEGMLFVFDKAGKYNFWMKDMNFPIDIIWIGEDMKVVYIKKDADPKLYPETYGPELDAKYVLEVVSGFSEKNNLKVGDEVLFTY